MIAREYEGGAYWVISSFSGWHAVVMAGPGWFGTLSMVDH